MLLRVPEAAYVDLNSTYCIFCDNACDFGMHLAILNNENAGNEGIDCIQK